MDVTQGCLKPHLLGLSPVYFLGLSLATGRPFGPGMGGVGHRDIHGHTLQKSVRASSRCRLGAATFGDRTVVVEDLWDSRAKYRMELG